jgi:hypothetical protein
MRHRHTKQESVGVRLKRLISTAPSVDIISMEEQLISTALQPIF